MLTNLKETDMANDWILDVLADLKKYATKNGLSALARQLDDATLIAATEIATIEAGGQDMAIGDFGNTGRFYRTVAARESA